MLIKIIVLCFVALMIYNLFKALKTMNSDDPNKPPMSKFIGRRVMVSAALIVFLIVLMLTGVITPNPRPY